VAFHDEDLARTCGVDARIDAMEAAELDRIRVAGRERIPLFAELLEAFPDARINVDCKSDGALEPLSRMLRSAEVRERVCVGSFSDKRLRWLREEHGPSLCTSMGPREVGALRLGLPLPSGVFAAQIPPSQGPIPLVTPGLIDRAHRHGIAVHVWTIDEERQMGDLLDLGVDGIMTDRPTVLRDVLQRRDQWEDWARG
jgi:glycerophosphoryl diester phosphodiesterase